MKIKELYNKTIENWPVKAICILLSIMLYCFYTLSLKDSRAFIVPLKIEASNGIVPAGSYPTNVKVTLKGKTEEISSIRESDVRAYLDLNYLSKDGVYNLPVLISLPKEALLLDTLEVKVSPQNVDLTVEQQISSFVKVNPLIKGEVAPGFEIKNITVTPDFVEISGPRSMVKNRSGIQTRAVSVKNAETSISSLVSLENLGGLLKLKTDEDISLTVEIAPIIQTKKYENVSLALENIPSDFDATPQKAIFSITLKGAQKELENLKAENIVLKANCINIQEEGTFEFPIEYKNPSDIEVIEITPKNVLVSIKKKEIKPAAEKEIISEKTAVEAEKIDESSFEKDLKQNEITENETLPSN